MADTLDQIFRQFTMPFDQIGGLRDIEEDIERAEAAVAAMPIGHHGRGAILGKLGFRLHLKYRQLGMLEDLEKAIERTTEALEAIPADHPYRGRVLNNLGAFLVSRYERLGTFEDLEKAIEMAAEVTEAMPPNHPDWALRLNNLSNHLSNRYKRLGTFEDLEKAIELAAKAVEATSEHDPYRGTWLDNLGSRLSDRYQRLGTLADLEKAIELAAEALEATPSNHPDRALRLNNLSNRFSYRYRRLGTFEDLEKAIELAVKAVEVIPSNHPGRASLLGNLGSKVRGRYERLGALEDLEKAIELAVEAVEATPANHPGRAHWLNDLGNYFNDRYRRLGTLEDLGKAIERATKAVEATPADHPDREHWLHNLSNHLSNRYKRLGDLEDLEKAIELTAKSLEAIPPNYIHRATWLNDLGSHFSDRYGRLGTLVDLDKAVELIAEAIEATPANHPHRVRWLNNLGSHLSSRYSHLGALADLDKAIELATEALEATPADHPDWAGRLSNLGRNLGNRYHRLGTLVDLEKAIELAAEAVEVTPADDSDRAKLLGNLGSHISDRHKRLGVFDDLEKAIELTAEALEATPANHPDRAIWLSNLGSGLRNRYNHLGTLEDFEKAMEHFEEALKSLPPDHLLQGTLLSSLGSMLVSIKAPTSKDLNYALEINLKAWNLDVSPPCLRIHAALNAANIYFALNMLHESCSLFENAVKLLPAVCPRFLQRDDQQHQLSEFSQLASIAFSVALQAGSEVSHCLSLLELGRGIIMGLVIDCRSDLSELQIKNCELAEKFNLLRTKIDTPREDGLPSENTRRRRVQAIRGMKETLDDIRKQPGFEDFQLPPSPEKLMAIAGEGPIVVLNCTLGRSDALIVTPSAIQNLPLPGLVYKEVNEKMEQITPGLTRGKRSTYSLRNKKMTELLLWLWDLVVEPVLTKLGININSPEDELPRIWWIGVGLLSRAPFHAAGDHSPGSIRNTLSQAISSYIPTIKALSYARERKLELNGLNSRLLLVSMPETPCAGPLRNATQEVEEIAGVVQGKAFTFRLDSPSTNQVLEELPSYHAIHFACHGVSDPKTPSNSHLLFLGADGSGSVDKLTVGAVSDMNIKNAQIAYLSACCTANNRSMNLSDESIHIASGFQLAGFSHVLATLWESHDGACRQVAGDFYRRLFNGDGRSVEGHKKVSTAFHHAVKKLRDENWRQPIKWASLIHTGA